LGLFYIFSKIHNFVFIAILNDINDTLCFWRSTRSINFRFIIIMFFIYFSDMCQNNVSSNQNDQQIPSSDPQQQLTATSSHHQLSLSAGQDEPQQKNTRTVQHQLTEAASQQHLHNQLTTLAGLRKQEEQQQLLSDAADKRQTPAAGSQREQLTNGRALDRACQSANCSPYPARLRHPILDHHRLQQASFIF
jgi:hypothetical protein